MSGYYHNLLGVCIFVIWGMHTSHVWIVHPFILVYSEVV